MVQRVFVRAFSTFKNPAFLVPALALGAASPILTRTLSSLLGAVRPHDLSLAIVALMLGRTLVTLASAAFAVWSAATVLAIGLALMRGAFVSFRECVVPVDVSFRLLLVEVSLALAIGLGLLLFIVPGVFGLVVWSQVRSLIVDGRANLFDAFGDSRDMTEGIRGEVFAVVLCQLVGGALLFGCVLGVATVSGLPPTSWPIVVGSLVITAPCGAFMIAVSAAMYLDVSANRRTLTRDEFYLAPATTDPAH